MRKKIIAILLCIISFYITNAQIADDFSDGDFTANPVWTPTTGDWIVNATNQLQSNNTTASSTFYITTPSTLATATQWELFINLTFNTSSANYVDVYLTATAADLSAATTDGYFVRIGGTADEISLYKKQGGISTKIIDGTDGITNNSANAIKLKVIRDNNDLWNLQRDVNASGFSSEGTVTDNTFNTSSFFGILVKQSNANFFQKHFFDDINIQAYTPDVTAPTIVYATAVTSNTVDVLFSESVDAVGAQVATNYVANNSIGAAATATIDGSNSALVHLTFANNFPNGVVNTLTVNGIQDVAGNTLNNGTATFSFYTPQPYDIVIDEIMADPDPQVGLPNNEWIELRNTTAFPINLQGWKIGDGSGLSGALPNYILKPDSFLIVCTGSAVAALSPFGATVAVTSFPSLGNDGDLLYLQDASGNNLHAVNYIKAWYANDVKQDGGWTLEMIDSKNPCAGANNWKASTDASGGTPGRKNSVDGVNNDATNPKLVRAYTTNATTVVLVFDEPLNSVTAAATSQYSFSDGITVTTAIALAPFYNRVELQLSTALISNKVYTITVSGVTDCKGNTISNNSTVKVGFAEQAQALDVIINEILFNPPTNGSDYVEIYNRSNKIIDLSKLYLANRNSLDSVSDLTQITTEPYLLFPQDFMVLTGDPTWVKSTYVANNPNNFITVATPSYSDDKGDVIITSADGIIDELKYSEKWHFKLIDNREGVALERIDYDAATQNESNWHSAATNVGYGTPTYKNSQYKANAGVQGEITVTPEIVSPDNDGTDDFATIEYKFPQPGYVANITIFDAAGRPVKLLQKNALCGISGNFRWDGLGDKNQQLATGVYVILTEIFNLQGKVKKFKNTIVVARRN